ncbi:MAG TPA: MFS transporter [Pyrinomonadaceae bacterium]|nr:MFS transporter [Pyrinomonadaceae bacterium]
MSSNALAVSASSPADRGVARTSQTVGYFASFVALGLTVGTFGPTLPGLAAQVGAALGGAGFLFMARSLGYLVGSSRGGRLFDRASGHALMAAALLVMALTMALVPLVPALWVLPVVLLLLALGLSMASIFPTTLTFAGRRMTLDGQVTGWFIVGASAGSMLLPWTIGQLFERVGPRATMLVIAAALAAAVVVVVSILRAFRVNSSEGFAAV